MKQVLRLITSKKKRVLRIIMFLYFTLVARNKSEDLSSFKLMECIRITKPSYIAPQTGSGASSGLKICR